MADTIEPAYEAFYIHGMLFNAQSAFLSIVRSSHAFENIPNDSFENGVDRDITRGILNDMQNIIVHAAALSRYFWPVRSGHQDRGAQLRQALAIDESNPTYSRDLRNSIEHFDERLDRYLSNGIVGVVIPEYVGPKPIEDGVPGHLFRAFFTDTGEFRLLNEDHNMTPITTEIIRIRDALVEADENGSRLPNT
ncbi:hypothetical protein [Salinisphaera sp. LB1]|uniref:hypothetical protein n=1 Tax=Salinisphaera sp. LB1 TaxID=2183911 RepID=UPI000FF0F6D5|nr:hypothetical protein [Salinisphaera sp. LB1]